VTFEPLSAQTVQAITRKELEEMAQREGPAQGRGFQTDLERGGVSPPGPGWVSMPAMAPGRCKRTLETLVVTPAGPLSTGAQGPARRGGGAWT